MNGKEINGALKPYQIVEQEFSCDHKRTKVVRFTQRNGVAIVRCQCQRCGAQVGATLPKAQYNVEKLPEWDEVLKDKWWAARSERSSEIYEQQRVDENAEWFRQYNAYLESEHWRRIRKLVLTRDNYTCQGCFRKVAPNIYPVDNRAEVHHQSYDAYNRLGYSFPFECVTLCHDCHRRYHGGARGADE
jgi:5-methylcytosine-specific restriction endonuclease McrA